MRWFWIMSRKYARPPRNSGPSALPRRCHLRNGDLHMIDVIAIPDRFKKGVCKAEDQHVLHRLLAQIVVDAKDLRLIKDARRYRD